MIAAADLERTHGVPRDDHDSKPASLVAIVTAGVEWERPDRTTCIVVGVDGSPASADATAWAAAQASAAGVPLHIVHVLRLPPFADSLSLLPVDRATSVNTGMRILDDAVRTAAGVDPALTITAEISASNDIPGTLLRAGGPDSCIVIGRGCLGQHGTPHHRSLTMSVVRRARSPVAIAGLSGAARGSLTGRVAVVLSGREDDAHVARAARREAERRGALLTVLDTPERAAGTTGAALVVMGLPARFGAAGRVAEIVRTALMATSPVVLLPRRPTPTRSAASAFVPRTP